MWEISDRLTTGKPQIDAIGLHEINSTVVVPVAFLYDAACSPY